ncbi:MAG: YolD-like family protein [Lachnospiraceae bacterium]|nr:YolD-like family protein [Lachnospiraceae bacterium]
MSREMRAKQFMPFAALKGLTEALQAQEKIVVPQAELSEDQLADLDEKMHRLHAGSLVTVVYYQKGEYLKKTGMVAKILPQARQLQVVNTRIDFDAIYSIDVLEGDTL